MKRGKFILLVTLFCQVLIINLLTAGNSFSPNESIILHTDREIYISGENLFFKLYVIDDSTHKLSTISRIAYLVLRNSESKPVANICMNVKNGMAYGNIYLNDTMATGSYQLVAFTNWMKNKGELSYCYNEIFIANLFDKEFSASSETGKPENDNSVDKETEQPVIHDDLLSVTSDNTEYEKNERIRLMLALKDVSGESGATLSVSVYETTHGCELPFVNKADQSVDTSGINNNTALGPAFLPEIKGRIISGNVSDPITNTGIPSCKVMLSAVDSMVNLQYTESDSSGFFRFLLTDYYNDKEFIISIMNHETDKKPKIILDDRFKIDSIFYPAKFPLSPELRMFIKKSQDIVFVQKSYGIEAKIGIPQPEVQKLNMPFIYYKPVSKVYPADYVSLPDFTEISRELLPTVRVRNQDNKYSLRLTDLKRQGFFATQPSVFLNGVMIEDINQIIPLGSNQIERIEAVNSQVVFGSHFFEGGILAVFTKETGIQNIQLYPNAVLKMLEPYIPFSTLETPLQALKRTKDNPDFRQQLYWNPNIAISGTETREIELYTSAHTGSYCIKILGISSTGHVINSESYFNVR